MKRRSLVTSVALLLTTAMMAQNSVDLEQFKRDLRTITTAVPFLLIAPDSRSGAMGDAGVSLSPDANSLHWNPSKIAFAPNELEISLGYSPWLKNLVPDINMAYLAGYYRLNDRSSIGSSLRYFSLGDITFTDQGGNVIGQFRPNEFAIDGTYALKLNDKFSMGISLRYIYSNLTNGIAVGGVETKPGTSVATDISCFYTTDIKLGDKDGVFSFGANISNIGSKMAYSSTDERDFIPINLRIGPTLTVDIDEFQKFTITTDLNKLLVPSQPAYSKTNPNEIVSGKNPDVGVAAGMFQSFYDAPGLVIFDEQTDEFIGVEPGTKFKEEMREINIAAGMEYWYADQFAIRAGYFHEHYTKGNRRFFTVGAGLKYKVFALDFSYLIPTSQQNPLANTLRFTLRFNFADLDADGDES